MIGAGLGEAEPGGLFMVSPGKGFREEDRLGITKLNLVDQPFPKSEGFGVGILDPEDVDALFDPEQHHVA
jgi:hypothetical protein